MDQEEKDKNVFRAEQALILYSRHGFQPFITRHRIEGNHLSEGVPLTREALLALCAIVMPEIKNTVKFLPENVLAYTPGHDNGMIMWWRPAQVRLMHFHKRTKMPSGVAPLPAVLFMADGASLRVWALVDNKRPGPNTQLYHPPFFNILGGSSMCMGNMKPPKVVRPEDIFKWEGLFFDSAFTTDGQPILRKMDAKKLWRDLINKKAKRFPIKHLAPAGKVKNLLEGR